MKKITQQVLRSKIEIVGYFSSKITQFQEQENPISQVITHKINQIQTAKKNQEQFEPHSIAVESNSIAIIDNQQKGWLITDNLREPVCVSDLLHLKINSIAMGYNQLIANTREGSILLVWGINKQLHQAQMTEYPIRGMKNRSNHCFEASLISQSRKGDKFIFPNLKKVTDSESLFAVHQQQPEQIVSYPSLQKIAFRHKVVGLSVGKYHKLCWDNQGKLYSWGCKSLALGHKELSEDLQTLQPKLVDNLSLYILKAYAGVNYSLAVTLEGKLYQWGTKAIYPKGEELIFEPREILLEEGDKIIDLKGRGEKYGVLTVSGYLYIWGKNSQEYVNGLKEYQHLQQQSFSRPVLLKHIKDFVIDFSMCESFLGIISSTRKCMLVSDSQKRYWVNLKSRICKNLRYRSSNAMTEGCEPQEIRKCDTKNRVCLSLRKYADPIEIAFERRQAKRRYFREALDSDKIINSIMEMEHPGLKTCRTEVSFDRENNDRQWKHKFNSKVHKSPKDNKDQIQKLFEECQTRKTHAQYLVKGVLALQSKNKMYRIARNNSQKMKYMTHFTEQKSSYSSKLEEVLKKKDEISHQFFEKTLRKLENDSVECRMRKRNEVEEIRKKRKQIEVCKHSLQKALVKAFLVKMLTKPVGEARQIKIQNFAVHLKLQRLQNKIRGVFVKNRIKIKMKKMFHNQLFRYFLLTVMFRKYVKQFRLRAFKKQRKFAAQEMFKSVVKQKIKMGIATCTFNVRKLQKFREWVVMVKSQRKKCLKYMWKVYLLSNMKINSDHESSAIFYLPKNVNELMFETLYSQKIAANPLLKLTNFLEKYSIFKIKATYFQKLVTLFTFEAKVTKESRGSKFINSLSKTKKGRIKFHEEEEVVDRLNLMQTDILPYSMHYNLLIRPKNYDITLPEMMKQHEKWIRQERQVFEKHIDIIIQENGILQRRERRHYDIELAQFINRYYDQLSEKRWKYIIEFNQTKPTFEKVKKETELRRLLKLIGAEGRIEEDCLPEKYVLLEEAMRRPDAPIPPTSSILFTFDDFRRHFKSYFESMFQKLKESRRLCF